MRRASVTDNLSAVALAMLVDVLSYHHDEAGCENPYNCGTCCAVAVAQRARMRLANRRNAASAVGWSLRGAGRMAERRQERIARNESRTRSDCGMRGEVRS